MKERPINVSFDTLSSIFDKVWQKCVQAQKERNSVPTLQSFDNQQHLIWKFKVAVPKADTKRSTLVQRGSAFL